MSADLHYWNNLFDRIRQKGISHPDEPHWLTTYLPWLRGQHVQRILEIGCGTGADTQFLTRHGYDVTATDYAANALAAVRDLLPDVKLLLHDTRQPFPFTDGAFDMVLASLSLHYFDEATTRQIVRNIGRLLRPKGLLLFRVNSTNDTQFTYGQGDLLEENFFLQNGIRRRYFTLESCRSLFTGWEELVIDEKQVHAYDKTKALCEGLIRKT